MSAVAKKKAGNLGETNASTSAMLVDRWGRVVCGYCRTRVFSLLFNNFRLSGELVI